MKRLTAFILALLFILMLSGCSELTPGEQDVVLNLDDVDNAAQTSKDDCLADTISDGEKGNDINTVCPPTLTLQTLQDIVNLNGENLTWADLTPYYSKDVGSGLYILQYPIDWDYCLLIGGDSMDLPPMYIHLVSEHDPENYIDVRFDSIDDFISNTPKISDFSYDRILETYKENDPGVKYSGFNNISRVAMETISDVLRQAKGECTIEFDTIDISFDSTASIWQVLFYKTGAVGGDQTIYMDSYGVTCLVVYGE